MAWQRKSPAQRPPLGPCDIHVWKFEADAPPGHDDYLRVLSPRERARAANMRHIRKQQEYLWTQTRLRLMLSHYLGAEPQDLVYGFGDHGKPYLTGSDVQFNLTHSGSMALLAVASKRQVGIDIEFIKPRPVDALARRFFHSNEAQKLATLAPEEKLRMFVGLWTRKEALLKAFGLGITRGVKFVEFVELDLGKSIASFHCEDEHYSAKQWAVLDLPSIDDYGAALAYESIEACAQAKVSCWAWDV